MDIPNVSSWRLNKAENQELQDRVKGGEPEIEVKREIQRRKAIACEERKKAAAAIASKTEPDKPSGKKRKEPASNAMAEASSLSTSNKTDPTNAAYYAAVEADLQAILKEFPGLEKELPLALSSTETDKSQSGVQEPYNLEKGKNALRLHQVYRCCLSLFSLNVIGSPTPGIPMSRRRVIDMAAFYYPNSAPAYMTGRQVEVWADKEALSEKPENLQMISPEELVHSMIAACAQAIRWLVCMHVTCYKHLFYLCVLINYHLGLDPISN